MTPWRAPALLPRNDSPVAVGRSVLLVDDDAIQLKLMRAHLVGAGFSVRIASDASEALQASRQARPDAIISDVHMNELDGFMLCSMFRCDPELGTVPIVLVTAHVGGDDDRKLAVSVGAHSLVERSPDFRKELAVLQQVLGADSTAKMAQPWHPEPYVRRMAHQMARLLVNARAATARCESLLENANEAIALLTPDGVILEINQACADFMQSPRELMVGRHIKEFAPAGQADSYVDAYREAVESGRHMPIVPIVRPDGTTLFTEWSTKLVRIDSENVVLSIGRDVTESVIARRSLAASEEKYRTLVEGIPDVVWSTTLDGQVLFMSRHVNDICGFTAEELAQAPTSFWLDRVHKEDVDAVRTAYAAILETGYTAEYRWQHKDGHWIWLRSHASTRMTAEGTPLAEGTFTDITEQKRLEEQLRQAQKMEAIGQLTGGIAHDFNNILAVILGNGEFLREALPEGDPRRADAESILEAGQRAAALTRQLLAFSRRQVVQPRTLDLNQVVTGVEKMLRRVIGEDIELSCALAKELDAVRADAGQVEQIIMNLVVNARDAMPLGGRLSIETANVVLEGHAQVDLAHGSYVMLAVSDTGCGMDAETKRRLFEPFFTTKGMGKGTGLGLSTCYGIAQQHGGGISVYSERGHGSVFKVYLPITSVEAETSTAERTEDAQELGGSETILVVEDDHQVRATVRRALANLGYEILEARDGQEALAISTGHNGDIDLVLSDVIMPDGSGPEIVKRVQDQDGHVKALFMSGYTDHAVLRDQLVQTGMNFIQKPFAPMAIARKVRDVLDAPRSR